MKFFLTGKCRFVEGAKKAAIYDFESHKVYSINSAGKHILNKALSDADTFLDYEEEYLNQLLTMGLLCTDLQTEHCSTQGQ